MVDWRTDLAPPIAASIPQEGRVPTVRCTIWRIEGSFRPGCFRVGIATGVLLVNGVEFFGMVSFIKAGLLRGPSDH
jgi:hypothetical protein